MSYREIRTAEESLETVVQDIFKLDDEHVYRISAAIKDLAIAVADQEIDRLFNRGDFR
jgi:pyoverdine/dityrosine biosynthesis protein Dit1